MRTIRRTKILATLGPATDDPGVLRAVIAAGADTVRLNFSHGTKEDHCKRAETVREIAADVAAMERRLAEYARKERADAE